MTPQQWQARQRAIVTVATARLLALWGRVSPGGIGRSWDRLSPQATAVVTAAQRSAATGADRYVNATIATRTATARSVNVEALAGVASDGRPLETLLSLPGIQAGRAAGAGASEEAWLHLGRVSLADLAATQIYDAGRVAVSIATVTHPQAGGYRRQLRGPTNCSRCVVLAGAWYRWNDGFLRHPRCDCVHVPSIGPKSDVAGLEGFDPDAYFRSLSSAQQDRTFTKAGAQAIRDGADLGQVVNARRGMKTTTAYGRKILTTTEGTTVRGFAGRQLRASGATTSRAPGERYRRVTVPRLMPEQIYADAKDRDDAIRLLRRFGFI